MEIADHIDDTDRLINEYLERQKMLRELAKLRVFGMTYKKLSALVDMSPQRLASLLKSHEITYKEECRKNFETLLTSLQRNDPDYNHMTDPRTVTQQMCALLMGGEEVKSTLQQLADWKGADCGG